MPLIASHTIEGCTTRKHFCVRCGAHTHPDINRLGRCADCQIAMDPSSREAVEAKRTAG